MRIPNPIYRHRPPLPDWVAAIRAQLGQGGEDVRPEVPMPLAALNECLIVASAAAAGEGSPSKENRRSLCHDLSTALAWLGQSYGGALQPALNRFRERDLAGIPKLLDVPETARVLEGGVRVLLERFLRDDVIQSAWDDMLDAFSGGSPAHTCELRIGQLNELASDRGWLWSDLARSIDGGISDSSYGLLRLGYGDPSEVGLVDDRPSGLSIDERLDLCRNFVVSRPPSGELSVWLAYGNARLPTHVLPVGPVTFFSGYLFDDQGRPNPKAWANTGVPLPDLGEFGFFGHLAENTVLVRIELGHATARDAEARANELLDVTLYQANVASAWVRLAGAVVIHHGVGFSTSAPFREPAERAALGQPNPAWEPTGRGLMEVDGRMLDAVVRGDAAAVRTAEEVRWYGSVVRLSDPAQRVAFAARGLERLLPVSQDLPWPSLASRLLRAEWVRGRMWNDLMDAAWQCVHLISRVPGEEATYQAFMRAVFPSAGGLRMHVHIDEAASRIGILAQHLPPASLGRRLAEDTAALVRDGAAAAKWISDLDTAFQVLVLRAARQRNAVVHGTPTLQSVLRTVDLFSQQLGSIAVGGSIRAAKEGVDLVTLLEREVLDFETLRWRLDAGEAPVVVLRDMFPK